MNGKRATAPVHRWLAEPAGRDVEKRIERLAGADDVRHVAVMPDVHVAGDVCVGTSVATTNLLYPAAVGGDVGCGMAAVRFNADADLLAEAAAAGQLFSALYRHVPANRHSPETMPEGLSGELDAAPLSDSRLDKRKRRDGRVQFGTLGRGNHFLEFQADRENRLWLMVHSGSRAMGQAIAAHHLARASGSSGGLAYLSADTDTGRDFLRDVDWAVRYARANRRAMIETVARLLDGLFGIAVDDTSRFDCDHNHVRRETHFGAQYWVHRKGAQSARPGEWGIVPGSMGTASFHVAGRGLEESLQSASHGAGRKMTRTEARRRVTARRFRRQMESIWFDRRKERKLFDEAPEVYRDIHAVMRAQKELVRIERTLTPLLSYKGAC